VAAPTAALPWQVEIGAGYALGPYGDEIFVAAPVSLDLAQCGPGTVTDPCEPDLLHATGSAEGGRLFVTIKYAECLARPVRAMPAGCGCEEVACEYSRIRDSFQLECLTELPPSHQPPPLHPLLCDLINGRILAPCPPCPAEPWVVLAQVTLPASPETAIADSNLDNVTIRRQIFSTAVLQEQLIACCCERRPLPAPSNMNCDSSGTSTIVLNWRDNSEDESEFRLERSPDQVSWTEIATLPENTTTHRDTNLAPGSTFSYRVRAFRQSDGQFSDFSNVTTCTTVTPPPQLADLKITKELLTEPTRRYRIQVTNGGPSAAQNVVVTDEPPNSINAFNFTTTSGSWIRVFPDRPFVAQLGTVAPGQTVTLEFEVRFIGEGNFVNVARVESSNPDPDTSNNEARVETQIIQ
jgi:uncharacterized repeat protein (TIGR01451 family)